MDAPLAAGESASGAAVSAHLVYAPRGFAMKVTLTLTKKGQTLCKQAREVVDAASFAAACAEIWADLEQRALERATSVGEFMEHVNEAVADQLDGALLSFERE